MKTCSVPDCPNPGKSSGGLCGTHHQRLKRWGTLDPSPKDKQSKPKNPDTLCRVDGCSNFGVRPGKLCKRHAGPVKDYQRARRAGTLEPLPKPPPKSPKRATCNVQECLSLAQTRGGRCERHRQNQMKRDLPFIGDPLSPHPNSVLLRASPQERAEIKRRWKRYNAGALD